MKLRKFYPVVVLSDIHLGSEHARTQEVTRFLSCINCDLLILNGDIIDGWQLQKPRCRWKREHSDFFKVLMKMMEKQGTQIVYIRGNHDNFLDNLLPFSFSNMTIVKDYLLVSKGKTYLVTHGDVFDAVTSKMRWLARAGDWGYDILLALNKGYNNWRTRRGKSYYSLAQEVKRKVKSAVSYISNFETELVALAKSRNLDGIICGHIHQAANRFYGDIHYLNSGDWVESMTALVQTEQGEWQILTWSAELFQEQTEHELSSNYAVVV